MSNPELLCQDCVKRGDEKCSFEEALIRLTEAITPTEGKKITGRTRVDTAVSIQLYLEEAQSRNCPKATSLESLLKETQGQKPQTRP